MAERAKHAFGMLENVDVALQNGTIDSYDILFLKDANNKPFIGWIDKDGNKIIIEDKIQIVRVDELPTADGDENVVYIYNNEGYVWDATNSECVPMAKSADLTTLETQVSNLETQIGQKVDEATVDSKIETAVETALADAAGGEVVEF